MNEESITQYIVDTFQNVETADQFDYRFFFYGDDHRLPFATIAFTDNEYEKVSNLGRPGIFRLNIGVSKQRFQELFGSGEHSLEEFDFTELDRIMPHPDYSKQFFVCILNPGDDNLSAVKSMLAEAHALAEKRHQKRSATEPA